MDDCLMLPVAVPHLNVVSDCRTEHAPQGEQLTISTVAAHGRTFVIVLRGQLDVRTVEQARDTLAMQVAAGMRRMVADLSGLQFMGVAGARALLDTQALLIAQGGSMALARPQRLAARVLQLTGTDQYIPVYDTVSGAVRGRVPVPSRAP
jgi:anti-sigma B factor antagonist